MTDPMNDALDAFWGRNKNQVSQRKPSFFGNDPMSEALGDFFNQSKSRPTQQPVANEEQVQEQVVSEQPSAPTLKKEYISGKGWVYKQVQDQPVQPPQQTYHQPDEGRPLPPPMQSTGFSQPISRTAPIIQRGQDNFAARMARARELKRMEALQADISVKKAKAAIAINKANTIAEVNRQRTVKFNQAQRARLYSGFAKTAKSAKELARDAQTRAAAGVLLANAARKGGAKLAEKTHGAFESAYLKEYVKNKGKPGFVSKVRKVFKKKDGETIVIPAKKPDVYEAHMRKLNQRAINVQNVLNRK